MDSPRRFVLADAMIAIAIGGLALVLYGAIRFPASVSAAWVPFVMSTVGLLGYLIVGAFARRASIPIQSVLRLGGVVGLALAAAGVLNHTLEIAVQLPSALGAVLGPGMWGLMFLGFSIAWCGLVYAGVLVVFALAVGFAFMPHMEHILAGLYAASGMSDPQAFVTRHLVTNASSHIFVAPVIALVIGALGGLGYLLLRSVRRRTA